MEKKLQEEVKKGRDGLGIMCGICGILCAERGPVSGTEKEIVSDMLHRMNHRGPDGSGLFQCSYGVLGHRRLAIIDIEQGKQPIASQDGRYVLVFNGEIYNYAELRQSLIQRGYRFRTFCDTEVLLAMLMEKWAKALKYLNGMFAFLFLDVESGKWLMARDRFGIKPLYYATLPGGRLAFASEIKALLAHPDIKAKLNHRALNYFLTFQFYLGDITLFEGIKRVEAAHFITGRGGIIEEKRCYWDVNFQVDRHHTEEYFVERLRSYLQDSIRLQTRSDVPLGAYLSGGMDSSVVTTFAVDCLNSAIPVFMGRFTESEDYDESFYARLVSERIGATLHEIVPTKRDFVELLPAIIHHLDEPMAGPGAFPQFLVSQLAARHVKVVLGGQGGDEIFGGYARYLVAYLEQALKGAIYQTREEGKYLVDLKSIIPNLPLLRQYVPMIQYFWQDGLFGEMDARYFRLIDRSPGIMDMLTNEARASYDREEVFEKFRGIFNHPHTRSYINKMTHFDMKTLLPALLHVEDRMSMAHSLESRVPILDHRIVELVASVPPTLKFQGGQTKALLKKATRVFLPQEIVKRKDKMGFPVPLAEWMQEGLVREFVTDVLLSKRCLERGIYRKDALEGLVSNPGVGSRKLWGALCFELWCRHFLDGGHNDVSPA